MTSFLATSLGIHYGFFAVQMWGILYDPNGTSDDIGWKAAENPVDVHDFHATILHLLGIDHERPTFYHNGIQRRLTNVHGNVLTDLLA